MPSCTRPIRVSSTNLLSLAAACLLACFLGTLSAHATAYDYPNNTGITIQDNADASPFPSNVAVPAFTSAKVEIWRVVILGFTHTYPNDVDVYLQAPNGKHIILFSDAGGSTGVTNLSLSFADSAAAALPGGSALSTGTYRPDPGTDPTSDVFPAEANRVTTLRELMIGGYAGTWGLFVRDDAGQDSGSISGWGLEFDSPPGRMTSSREYHSATLLSSGKVLAAGGVNAAGSVVASTDLYDPSLGTWAAAGPMDTGRFSFTATSLKNGRVLVAGGANGGGLVQSEIYDPVADDWTPTGNLHIARYDHSAVRLPDGRVLVCGGNAWTNSASLASCEIYRPDTGRWTTIGSLGTGRYSHTATVLPDGRVLVTGGYTTNAGNQPLSSCEIYNPATGLWTPTGSLPEARNSHTATLLHSGVVLVAGGNNLGQLNTAFVYDPADGFWTATGSLTHARFAHTATLLPDNSVMVTGGNAALDKIEIYSPASGQWSVRPGNPMGSRTAHTATLLANGDVLLAGGEFGAVLATADLVAFPQAVAWSSFNNVRLNTARYSHTATLLPDGTVLVAGGKDSASNWMSSAEIVNPVPGTITHTANAMAIPRAYHTATLLPRGDVLVVGGGTASVDRYHPDTQAWSAAAPYPVGSYLQEHTATLLQDGRVLVAGGSSVQRVSRIYNPTLNLWTPTGDLVVNHHGHTATLLPDGRVLVVGGYTTKNQAELFDPAANGGTGAWASTGSTSFARLYHTATLLPSGRVLVVGSADEPDWQTAEVYDPQTGTWSTVAAPLYDRSYHRAVLLPDGRVWIQGGETQTGSSRAEIYDPVRDTWTEMPFSISGGGRLKLESLTLLLDGSLLQTGGLFSNAQVLYIPQTYVALLNRRFAPPEWYPQITYTHLNSKLGMRINGQLLAGLSEGSGGNGVQASAGIPLVQLRRLDNERISWLPLDPGRGFASIELVTAPFGIQPGAYAVTVFANGIPSDASIRLYHGEPSIELVKDPALGWMLWAYNLEADTPHGLETAPSLDSGWLHFAYISTFAVGGASKIITPTEAAAFYRVKRLD